MKTKLLFLHGALGTKAQFSKILELLPDTFELLVLDFEGHAGITSDNPYSIELFTNNVVQFLDDKGYNNVAIFGYSMGGYVALNFARQYPDKVKSIITLGTKWSWTPEIAAREVRMLQPDMIAQKIPHFAKKLAEDHSPLDWKIVVDKTAKMMLDLGEGMALKTKDFQHIKHHVTLGLGTTDSMVSLEETQEVCHHLPNAKLVLLEDVPHPIEKTDPNTIASFITQSLS